MDNQVKLYRLTNGENIVAESVEETTRVTFINPMKLIIDADLEYGTQTIYMHNWIPQGVALSNTCTIEIEHVLYSYLIEEDIKEYYQGVVFDLIEDRAPLKKKEESKTEYMDSEKKVISFDTKNKSNKDKSN